MKAVVALLGGVDSSLENDLMSLGVEIVPPTQKYEGKRVITVEKPPISKEEKKFKEVNNGRVLSLKVKKNFSPSYLIGTILNRVMNGTHKVSHVDDLASGLDIIIKRFTKTLEDVKRNLN